ncbi:MAG TPA: zf-TFIIB domain-containing protein [Thermoleophilaceae bacterium]
MADLTCPKCQGSMRSYERSGITVDQCSDCRGVFLDRGELERLVDAEGAYYEGRREPEPRREEPRREYDERREYDDRRRSDDDDERPFGGLGGLGGFGGGGHGKHGKRRKRESFLSELFD